MVLGSSAAAPDGGDGGQRTGEASDARRLTRRKLTEVGDPDGHALVEDVEDHDDDEADDGGRDRGGHLRRHVLLQRLQLLQVLGSELGGEGEEGGQAVDGDGNDGRHDEQNLKDEKRVKKRDERIFHDTVVKVKGL